MISHAHVMASQKLGPTSFKRPSMDTDKLVWYISPDLQFEMRDAMCWKDFDCTTGRGNNFKLQGQDSSREAIRGTGLMVISP
jgi:hypothetical protein